MFGRIKKKFFLLISTSLIIYFCFNLFSGDRGLFSFYKKKNIFDNLHIQEIKLIDKLQDLKFKNSLLTNNLDLDYIEILIRQKFLFGKENEKFYIIQNNEN